MDDTGGSPLPKERVPFPKKMSGDRIPSIILSSPDQNRGPPQTEQEYKDMQQRRQELQEINNYFVTYKRNLAFKIVGGFAVVFLLILHMVFKKVLFTNYETKMVETFQEWLKLQNSHKDGYLA